MLGGLRRAGGEQHLHPGAPQLVGDHVYGGVALFRRHVADVDGVYAAGMLVDDLAVDLRVALAGVADQDEGEIRIRREQRPYYVELVHIVLTHGREAPVLQEERTGRDAMNVEEILQHVVEVPGAAGDVEDRVEVLSARAELQSLVEVRHALERQARVGVAQQGDPDHLQEVRHARPNHRVVEVANNTEPGPGRHEHAPHRPRPAPFSRLGPQQLDLDGMPARAALQRLFELEAEVEEALVVGHHLQLVYAPRRPQGGAHPRVGDLGAQETAGHVPQGCGAGSRRRSKARGPPSPARGP